MASFVNIIGGKREFPVRRSDPYERRGGDSRGSKERARGQRRRQRREEKNRQERERERQGLRPNHAMHSRLGHAP